MDQYGRITIHKNHNSVDQFSKPFHTIKSSGMLIINQATLPIKQLLVLFRTIGQTISII